MKEGIIRQIENENNEPVIRLAGSVLTDNGFSADDFVRIEFSNNQIIISKNEETKLLQGMQRTNPSISRLIKEFNLDITI